MNLLQLLSSRSYLYVLNDLCILALNTKVAQLFDEIIRVHIISAGNFVKQRGLDLINYIEIFVSICVYRGISITGTAYI